MVVNFHVKFYFCLILAEGLHQLLPSILVSWPDKQTTDKYLSMFTTTYDHNKLHYEHYLVRQTILTHIRVYKKKYYLVHCGVCADPKN